MGQVKIALIQVSAAKGPAANLKKNITKIEEAARKGARIICLEELFLTPYFPQTENAKNFRFAETIPGPTVQALSKVARENAAVLIVPIFEKRTRGIYHNSAAVIDADGRFLGAYRKMHIPDDPQFFEKFYFSPGDSGFKVFKTRYAKISVLICWDQWFPEAARSAALQGAEIIFYPTAIGHSLKEKPKVVAGQISAWEIIQRSHAVANGIFVAACNRTGKEGGLNFWGNSFVSDPFGKIIARARTKEQIVFAVCDFSEIEMTRQNWPFMRDRRVDAYQPVLERFIDE
ncbi:MAG: carbon-nitrogen hydrolase [Candidatus Omnitrophica bacterium]|nr:carbon-nitrogen hydrolase [Candidatus Omnitrophota bacterium]